MPACYLATDILAMLTGNIEKTATSFLNCFVPGRDLEFRMNLLAKDCQVILVYLEILNLLCLVTTMSELVRESRYLYVCSCRFRRTAKEHG